MRENFYISNRNRINRIPMRLTWVFVIGVLPLSIGTSQDRPSYSDVLEESREQMARFKETFAEASKKVDEKSKGNLERIQSYTKSFNLLSKTKEVSFVGIGKVSDGVTARPELPISVLDNAAYAENAATILESGGSGRVFGLEAVIAYKSEFPECVAVGRSGSFIASGVILKGGVVLTAAHICDDHPEAVPDQIWLGTITSNCRDAEESGEVIRVSRYLRHPDYKFDGDYRSPIGNDLMLLEIHPDDRTKVSHHAIRADFEIDLQLGSEPYRSVRAVGYGHSRINHLNRLEGYGIRRHVSLALTSRDAAGFGLYQKTLNGEKRTVEFVSASKIPDDGDTCKGDSGGPLYIVGGDGNGDFQLVGIVSRATPGAANICGDGSINTSVMAYESWISESVADREGWKLIER